MADDIFLFKQYPKLKKSLPYITLGTFPTPVLHATRLGSSLGAKELYIKNDGASRVPFGGNKVRKLEFLLADALKKGAKTVVTVGQSGSNHALTTIICAKKLGLEAYSMLSPQLNATYVRRNLLLSLCHGGKLHYFDTEEERDAAAEEIDAYFIPLGGSNAIGALGFVNAAFELKHQVACGVIPEPDYIYIVLGSCGTAAGLMLGLKLAGLKSKVVPVRISGEAEERKKNFFDLLRETSGLLHEVDSSCELIRFKKSDIHIRHDFVGEEYAHISPEVADAIKVLYKAEGVKLEGTYTGKAFAALLCDLKNEKRSLKNKTILFWNTFCSGAFNDAIYCVDYRNLPEGLHDYFEQPVQELDQGV